ncbi:VOC family protein [Paraburkholderia oxyphila]|uniref:VOC family protein n=1 Tax=Paraburkholderia oxyphila TaxID=614212 RepID=UPI000486082A|nr:VOC family protein [Paraburkholderia oxyphila]
MNTSQTSLPEVGKLRLNNFALAVGDLDRMVSWYVKVLGFEVTERGRFDAVGAAYAMLDGMGFRLELISRPGTRNKRPVDRTVPPDHLDVLGWKALVLETQDLPVTTAALSEQGVDIVWAELPLSPAMQSTMIRDPEGNLINIFGSPGHS